MCELMRGPKARMCWPQQIEVMWTARGASEKGPEHRVLVKSEVMGARGRQLGPG